MRSTEDHHAVLPDAPVRAAQTVGRAAAEEWAGTAQAYPGPPGPGRRAAA